jgi:hypothetical protein
VKRRFCFAEQLENFPGTVDLKQQDTWVPTDFRVWSDVEVLGQVTLGASPDSFAMED